MPEGRIALAEDPKADPTRVPMSDAKIRENLVRVLGVTDFFTVTEDGRAYVVGVRLQNGWSLRGSGCPGGTVAAEQAADFVLNSPGGTLVCHGRGGEVLMQLPLARLQPRHRL